MVIITNLCFITMFQYGNVGKSVVYRIKIDKYVSSKLKTYLLLTYTLNQYIPARMRV